MIYGADYNSLAFEHKEQYGILKEILERHKNNNHEVMGYNSGCLFFKWKSEREKLCDHVFKVQNKYKIIYVKPKKDHLTGSDCKFDDSPKVC